MKDVKWEMYIDPSYFHMWAVRDSTDRSFNSPRLFHMTTEQKAKQLLDLLKESE